MVSPSGTAMMAAPICGAVTDHPGSDGTSFTFLGSATGGGVSEGNHVVWQVTANNRHASALASITDWC